MAVCGTVWTRQFIGLACALAAASVMAWVCVAFAAAPPSEEAAPPGSTARPDAVNETAAKVEEAISRFFEEHLGAWASKEVLGVAVWQFLAAFLFILLGLVAKRVSDYVMERKIIPLLKRTPFQFDHLLAEAASKPIGYLLLLGGLGLAVAALRLPTEPNIRDFAYGALKVLLAADVVWFLFRVVDVAVEYLSRMAKRTQSKLDDQLVPLVSKALKVTIGVICGVWVVQLLGYSVSSLLAGLGIGGLAVALALQDSLANFFGSVFIFLDRPFAVGDTVKIGDVTGTVEQIGFRSTRIRTFDATLVAIPNKHVADSGIDNWTRRPTRRVFQSVGVTYETTADQMQQAVAAIRRILEADEGVAPEGVIVRFEDFGASSLDIRVVYFTKAPDYAGYLEARERVNLAIMRALEQLGLSIAFPTQTVYFEGDVARALAGRAETNRPETKG
jgi:MscS family membrane protein